MADQEEFEKMREFSRVPVKIQVKLMVDGEVAYSGPTDDVSMKGLFIKTDKRVPLGTKCDLVLFLDGATPPVEFHAKGKIQRHTDSGMGVRFSEIDLEAYDHLHDLVLMNSEDPGQVEKEFKEHLGIKKR